MADKMPVAGTTLSLDTAGGSSYSAATDVKSVSMGDESTESGDATHLGSTNRDMEFIGKGFIDGGKFEFELFLHQTSYGVWRNAKRAGTLVSIKWAGPLLAAQSIPLSIACGAVLEKCSIPQRSTSDSKNPYTFTVGGQWSGTKTVTNGS